MASVSLAPSLQPGQNSLSPTCQFCVLLEAGEALGCVRWALPSALPRTLISPFFFHTDSQVTTGVVLAAGPASVPGVGPGSLTLWL